MIQTKTHESGIAVVRPGTERLTAVNAKDFKTEVFDLIDTGSVHLVLDFSELTFLDSSGLGVVVGVLKKIGVRGELAVCGLNSDIKQMFKICHMDRVFSIFETEEDAIQSLGARV